MTQNDFNFLHEALSIKLENILKEIVDADTRTKKANEKKVKGEEKK